MFKRLAKKIAQKHMELRYPQQPLRLQPDYGERNAADFLGENVVQVNTGYKPLRGGPGNAKDEVIADEFEADFLADELEADFLADDFEAEFEAEELEGFEIVDDMGLDRMSDFWKESRFHSGPEGKKEFEQWKKDNPEAAETFDEQTEINKDVVKNRAKAMNSEDFQELDSEQKELEEKLEEIQEDKEEIVEDAGKKAHYEIIDDMGLERTAGNLHPHYSVLSRLWDAGESSSKGIYGEHSVESLGLTSQEKRSLRSLESKGYIVRFEGVWGPSIQFTEKGIEHYSEMDESHHTHDFRLAKDHEQSGSYMSRQNLREISDMADFIVDDIGMDNLDDWVEDKISHAHSAMNDVARYRGYRDDYPHGEESFKFAGRKMTPFEIVTNWFAQVEEESEGEIEYMMGVDSDDEMSGDVEILSGHDISSLIRDLERDLRWSNIEFSKSGRRTISWSLPTQSSSFEGEHFRFANDEIIDDMGIMADFDKESRYSKGSKGSKEYEDAKAQGKVPEEFLEYEGAVTTPGSSPNPSVVEKNRKELGGGEESPNAGMTALDRLAHYDIIDDLEW